MLPSRSISGIWVSKMATDSLLLISWYNIKISVFLKAQNSYHLKQTNNTTYYKHFILIEISDSILCCVLQLQKSCTSEGFGLAQVVCLTASFALLTRAFRTLASGEILSSGQRFWLPVFDFPLPVWEGWSFLLANSWLPQQNETLCS